MTTSGSDVCTTGLTSRCHEHLEEGMASINKDIDNIPHHEVPLAEINVLSKLLADLRIRIFGIYINLLDCLHGHFPRAGEHVCVVDTNVERRQRPYIAQIDRRKEPQR